VSIRNYANANRERLAIAEQIRFWRLKIEATSDPMRIAAYRRIVTDLVHIAEKAEAPHA
jgi:hypothetical protein